MTKQILKNLMSTDAFGKLRTLGNLEIKSLTEYSKRGLTVIISGAVAATALMAGAGANEAYAVEVTANYVDNQVAMEAAAYAAVPKLQRSAAPVAAAAQTTAATPIAASNPIALPAPAYVAPKDRIPVNFDDPAGFDHMADLNLPESNVGRSMSPTGLALLKDLEGLELNGYVLGDGMCTIGYGHAEPLSVISAADCRKWTITEAEAEAMLAADVQIYADAVANHFTRPLTQNQFDALTSFIYNVGTNVLEKYEWATAPGDESITGAMMLYVYPAKFTAGLTARRHAEIALFNLS